MVRNSIGIFFFILSGFFLFLVGVLAFFEVPGGDANKLIALGIYATPCAVFHFIGLFLYSASNWRVPTGIVLFIGGACSLLVAVSMLSIQRAPEVLGVDASSLDGFSEYFVGFAVVAVFMGCGAALCMFGKRATELK